MLKHMLPFESNVETRIKARFSQSTCRILDSLRFFDIELLSISSTTPLFSVHGMGEISFLVEKDLIEIITELKVFKFGKIEIIKQYQLLREDLTNNSLKLKEIAPNSTLQYVGKAFKKLILIIFVS